MQAEYRQSYWLLAQQNLLSSRGHQALQREHSITKLKSLNNSTAELSPEDSGAVQKRRHSCRIVDMSKIMAKNPQALQRIHNNHTQLHPHRNKGNKLVHDEQLQLSHSKTIEENGESRKRKDIYDNHIQKYVALKHKNQEIIQKYLTNKEAFIREACQHIEDQIHEEVAINKRAHQREQLRKVRTHLPKIDELSYMLKKTIHYNNNGPYMQDISHIKKAQRLDIRNRQRKLRTFKLRMNSLEHQLDKLRKSSQR